MCCARNGGSVMSTRLWCIYWLKALSCLAKGRKDASWGERYGGVVGLGGILGTVFPSLLTSICVSLYDAVRMRGWVEGVGEGG